MKNITMKTKMIVGFLIPSFLLVVNILLSDATTKAAVKYTDPVAHFYCCNGSCVNGYYFRDCTEIDQGN